MRFKGTPGMHVIDSETGKTVGMFSGRGYLEVEDTDLAARMKRRFIEIEPKQKRIAAAMGKGVKESDSKRRL